MCPRETFWFNEKAYNQKIHQKNYMYGELARNIYTKCRAIASSKASAVAGIACVHVSGGASLIGSTYTGRNINVEGRKLAALECFWESTAAGPLRHHDIRDTLIPITIATIIGMFTFNINLGISNVVVSSAYAAQMSCGYSFPISGHALSAGAFGVETGTGWMGKKANGALVGGGPYDNIPVQELHYWNGPVHNGFNGNGPPQNMYYNNGPQR
ncbi:hypothetical protein FIBSPDRAFT_894453 [Athelia psychrophila]|uniref:Uncharacterized protein n=1 Tax=Athelia psychrophila TaxID=1759441 RepID=A0A166FV26_9AGAM|nr:hypothetical protein FIBSPDRAFT_894453 [Fibularhizoctonia sp. CBS 109695]